MSNTAIVSKARAMYGRRLTPSDWEALLSCSSVADAAAYLKSNTAYSSVLKNVNESGIHRSELENLLRQRLMQETLRLSRYDVGMGEHTANYLLGQLEIDQLLHAMIRMNAGTNEQMTPPDPYLNHHTHFDQRAVDQAANFEQLLEAVRGTRYYKLLLPFRNKADSMENFTEVEHVLLTDLYEQQYRVIQDETHGHEREAMLEMFNDMVDLQNYAHIVRLKAYYHVTNSQIRACILPFGRIPKDKLSQMIEADTPAQVKAVMATTRVGKRAFQLPYDLPGDLITQVRYWESHRNLFFSSESSIVMLSYIFLMQTELANLVHLIEALRYGISKIEIKRLLNPYKFG